MNKPATATPTTWLIRILGLAVFALAFFLRALATSPHDSNPLIGWQCAKIALELPFNHEDPVDLNLVLVTLSGWLNVFLLIYLILTFFKKLQTLRRIFIVLLIASIFSTWLFFFREHYTPLIGHYLWILGTLIVITPEFFRSKQEA
jgi:hypothetical protein